MKRIRLAAVLFSILIQGRICWATPSADAILAKADRARMAPGDNKLLVKLQSKKPGETDELGTYKVFVKGNDRTLIETLEPKTDHGTSLLMVNQDLWVFVPDVSKPVRISLQQRLLGEVSNGDLARANFTGDYTPKIIQELPHLYILRLTAKSEDVTYGGIELAIQKENFRPLKAKFYAASGKLLKTGSYENYKMLAGAMRASRLVFTNALNPEHVSIVTYEEMVPQTDLPDKVFTKDYLKKLKY